MQGEDLALDRLLSMRMYTFCSQSFLSSIYLELLQRMVIDDLTEQEQRIAACTSYAYWAREQRHQKQNNCDDVDDETKRVRMAMREARRHYVGQNGDYDSALERFKSTLQWRKEKQVDLIRLCYSSSSATTLLESDTAVTIELSEKDAEACSHFERLIEADLRVQTMAVRGHDRENRPIIVKLCRAQAWNSEAADSDEAYLLAQLFVAERAIAAAELLSMGKSEKLTAIFDFGAYNSSNSPPVKTMATTLKLLQDHYPERIGRALVLDAPFWMQAFFKILYPFLSEKTRKNISMVGGAGSVSLSSLSWPLGSGSSTSEIREETVRALVEPEHAMPFMLVDAKLTSPIDVDQQLRLVPFHELYDYVDVDGG